jgi:hypothetical protein
VAAVQRRCLTSSTLISFLLNIGVHQQGHLGGAVVSALATGLKVCGFEAGQCYGFLRVIKIRSTPSFEWEVKPEVPCRKVLQHVKDLSKSHGDD